MTRVAALDCGTNSLRMLVADVADGQLRDVSRRMEIVRLGAEVDRTGVLAREALDRTFATLATYGDEARRLGVERVRMVATSATRDARNRAEFVAGVRALLGVDPEVVSGEEEAALSFGGVTRELAAFVAPYLVVDIGGGSTEFVLGDAEGPWVARSVDVGCVRLTERHLRDDPPMPEQVAALIADVEAALTVVRASVSVADAATLVGLAGTVTTIAGIALELPAYDAERIHLSVVSAADVRHVADRLTRMSHAERVALPVMHPGRVDVITAGALILSTIVDRTGVPEIVASEHDILDGIAWSLA